jgi:hypothetical protein
MCAMAQSTSEHRGNVELRRTHNWRNFRELRHREVRILGILRSSRVRSLPLGLFVGLHAPVRRRLEARRKFGVRVSVCIFQLGLEDL